MASVRKRTWKSGGETKTAWIADYFGQDGKRHIETFTTKKAAEASLVDTLHDVKEGTHTARSSSITIREAAEHWLKAVELKSRERSTLVQYRNHVEHHINPLLGHVKLADLTTPRVEKFADALRNRPYAEEAQRSGNMSLAMAKKVLASLKGIIKEAQRTGKIAKNPTLPVKIELPKRGRRKIVPGRDFPSKAEINSLLTTVASRWRPLIITAVFTGMRSSELRGLRWEDVDLAKDKVIHVRQRADAWGEMGPPKSEAGERTIALAPTVVNALKEWKLSCPRKNVGAKGEDDPGVLDLVFPNGDGKPESHANICNRGFYPLQVASGVVTGAGGAKYGFHTLRHFFASWIIEQDFSPKKVQAMLGHSSMQMTFDIYGHLFPSLEDDHAKLAAGEIALVG
jgi:integrase